MTTTNNAIRMNVTLVEAGRHDAENYFQVFVFDGCEDVEEMFDAVEFAIWDRVCETYPGIEEARCFGDIVNAGQNDTYGRPAIIETELGVFDIGYAYDPDDLEAVLHAEGFTVEDAEPDDCLNGMDAALDVDADAQGSDDVTFEKRVRLDANKFYQVQIRILPVANWEPDDGWRTVFITSVYDHAIEQLSKEPGRDVDSDDLPF